MSVLDGTAALSPLPSAFAWQEGDEGAALSLEGVSLAAIVEAVGTPCYVYSSAVMEAGFRAYQETLAGLDPLICYALKANSNQAVIKTFAGLGAGADVVSGGELERARQAGIPAGRIVFAGVGKTRDEMAAGLALGIRQFNIESEPELEALSAVALAEGREAPVALRVNPDIDAGTHAKITTGRKENKFGIPIDQATALWEKAVALPGILPRGLAVHIGSQLTDLTPFRAAYERLASLAASLQAAGHRLDTLDLGGGVGIRYGAGDQAPDLAAYGAIVRQTVGTLGCRLVLEPGRSLVGEAGGLLSRVLYVKYGESRRFVILDAAMNDLLRPALYDALHPVVLLRRAASTALAGAAPEPRAADSLPADLVGPVCETGDTFARGLALPPVSTGDLLVLGSAGAYGAVMASTYNTRPLLPEVLVKGDRFAVVRARQSLEDLIRLDRLPDWM